MMNKEEAILWALILVDSLTLNYNFVKTPIANDWIKEFKWGLLEGLRLCNNKYCYSSKAESTLSVMKELISKGYINSSDLARRFSFELRITNNIRKYSIITSTVIRSMRSGRPWHESVLNALTKFNIPDDEAIIRSTPIPLFFKELTEIITNVERQVMATHMHPEVIEASKAYATSIYLALNNTDYWKIMEYLINTQLIEDRMLKLKIKSIEGLINRRPKDVVKVLNNNYLAISTLTTALYCVIKNEADFINSILCCISLGGDVSSRAIIASTLSVITSGLPHEFIVKAKEVDNYEYIRELIKQFKVRKDIS